MIGDYAESYLAGYNDGMTDIDAHLGQQYEDRYSFNEPFDDEWEDVEDE